MSKSKEHYKNVNKDLPIDSPPAPVHKLKFPVIPDNIEFMDIIKNRRTVISYYDEIAGKGWRALSEKLFEDGVPAGTYNYKMKFKNSSYLYRGGIVSIDRKGILNMSMQDSKELNDVKKSIEDISKKLKDSAPGLGVDFILSSMQRSHESEIKFYTFQITQKDELIKKLEADIKQLEKDCDTLEIQLSESNQSSSVNKYLDIALQFLNKEKTKKIQLKEDLQIDVPDDIILILNQVDYNQIPPETLEKLKQGLTAFIQQLPLKK